MKIKYAIMGSDTNPFYYDFWPIISKVWKEIFNITPVLGLICNEDSDFIKDEYGIIKKFKSIDGVDIGLQTQIVRFYLTTIMDDVCITSDIDMVPLSKKYFIDFVEQFDKNKFYLMTTDNQECLQNKEYQMCYNVGLPNMFSDILKIDNIWSDFVIKLNDLKLGWTTDQKYLYDSVNSYSEKDKIILLKRGFEWYGGYANYRIDRAFWSYSPEDVKNGNYIDSHLLRPYQQNKDKIDSLINLLFK